MKIEAKNLELAYTLASEKLNCSVTELDIKIIQYPTNGILGFFSKNAIIEANLIKVDTSFKPLRKPRAIIRPKDQDKIINSIKEELKNLFCKDYFDVDYLEVKIINKKNVFVKLDGKDTPLLIGKEGRVYKAISHLLFAYINQKYNLGLELEIGDFIKIQRARISKYLDNIVQKVEQSGKAITKPFDSILIKIALDELRERLPNKYVGIKTSKDGKYIVINDFKK